MQKVVVYRDNDVSNMAENASFTEGAVKCLLVLEETNLSAMLLVAAMGHAHYVTPVPTMGEDTGMISPKIIPLWALAKIAAVWVDRWVMTTNHLIMSVLPVEELVHVRSAMGQEWCGA